MDRWEEAGVCSDSFRICLPGSLSQGHTKLWMAFAFHVESDNKHGSNHKAEAAIWVWQGRKGGDNRDENGPLVGH